MNLEKDENVDGWIFIDSELPKSEWSISAQFFHDLDDHWLSHKFAPITLRNGLAHPSTPDLVDDLGTIFFLLSHYSECLQPEKDVHNRVSAMHSLVVEKNWQNRCVVNECAERFLKQLSLHFSNVKWEMPQVSYRITHDVDRPLKYAFEKPSIHLKRGLGSYRFGNSLKNIIKEIGRISLYPLLKDKVDPFNHFKWILRENNNFGSTPLFYWIPIQAHAEFDSLYQLNDKKIQIIFDHLISAHALMGCHPNYNSSETLEGINNNWEEFQKSYSNNEIKRNRQHFLKFDPLNFPEQLQLAQVNEDSSYGWQIELVSEHHVPCPIFFLMLKTKGLQKSRKFHCASWM